MREVNIDHWSLRCGHAHKSSTPSLTFFLRFSPVFLASSSFFPAVTLTSSAVFLAELAASLAASFLRTKQHVYQKTVFAAWLSLQIIGTITSFLLQIFTHFFHFVEFLSCCCLGIFGHLLTSFVRISWTHRGCTFLDIDPLLSVAETRLLTSFVFQCLDVFIDWISSRLSSRFGTCYTIVHRIRNFVLRHNGDTE